MNDTDCNILLTEAGLMDPRMRRRDKYERADMAVMWSRALPDVSLEEARQAMVQHYRESTEALLPADILRRVDRPAVPVRTPQDLWLIRCGIDPDEYHRAIGMGNTPRQTLELLGYYDAIKAVESD